MRSINMINSNIYHGTRKLVGTILPLLFFILCVALFIFFVMGTANHEKFLPRGYSLVGDHGSWEICDYNDNVVIGPNVRRYAVYDKTLITGEVVKSEDEPDSVPGMFVIDMQTRKVYQGLDEVKWKSLIRSYGILEKPKLRHP